MVSGGSLSQSHPASAVLSSINIFQVVSGGASAEISPPLPADLWPHLSGHWDLVAQWSSSASGPLHPGSHTSSLFPPRPTLQAGSTTMLGFKPKSRHDWAATLSFAKGYKTLKRHLEAERGSIHTCGRSSPHSGHGTVLQGTQCLVGGVSAGG